jgi:hemolysin activation/secretion protein
MRTLFPECEFSPILRVLWVAGILVGSCSAQAQTVPNVSAGSLLGEQRQAERQAEAMPAPQPVIEAPAPRPAIKLPEGVRIAVTRFKVTGAKAYPGELLAGLVAPWESQEIDLQGLNEAAGAITRHYQRNGYLLAYAYLPVQKIEQGVVEIAVMEGVVDAIQIVTAQDVRLNDEVIQAHLDGLREAPNLLQSDLESRLLRLNDIPGVVARAAFTPGQRPGSADIVVTVAEEEPLTSSVDFDNHGGESTGEYRVGATFHLKNLFGWGDSTRLRLQTSSRLGLVNGGLTTRVPLGGEGWSFEGGLSRLTYELGESYADLGARGEATVISAGFAKTVRRTLTDQVSVRGGLQRKYLRDIIAFVSDNEKHSDQLTLGVRGQSLSGSGGFNASLELSAGTVTWDSARPADSPSGHFAKINLEEALRYALGEGWSLSGRLSAQYAWDNLDSSEKLSLTGPYAVRAYVPGEASVDRGLIAALELRHAWPLTGGTLTGMLFYDYAMGQLQLDPAPSATGDNTPHLRGGGLGLSWQEDDQTDYSLTAGWRGSPAPTGGNDRNPYIYFQMTLAF